VVPAGDAFLYENDQSFPLRPQQKLIQREGTHTTHLTVSDKEGNVVSYTFTIESWGGSGIVVPGYGFLLNNEMTDFDFTGPAPNIPEAGKRPRSSMAPTIVLKDGKPAFTIGSPGGATIITTVLQTIVNHVDLGMPMDKAIDAPRLSQRNGRETSVEPGFAGTQQAQGLENFGHKWEDQSGAGRDRRGERDRVQSGRHRDGGQRRPPPRRRHGAGAEVKRRPASTKLAKPNSTNSCAVFFAKPR
jgi:gamma-glutamyltranspeptidase/glutathione hydrolase